MIDRETYEKAVRTLTEDAARLGLKFFQLPDGVGWCLQGQGDGAKVIQLPAARDVVVLLDQREEAMVAAAANAAIEAARRGSKGGAA